ncbi:54S ribosomal protein L4 mitochondrial [Bulinus truncatus]|nr:54S ribosomal protein L4 mitochondrial [Bulinus truncatus]
MALKYLKIFVNSGISSNKFTLRVLSSSSRLQQINSTLDSTSEKDDDRLSVPDDKKETPVILSRTLKFPSDHASPCLAWLDSLSSIEGSKLGMLDLHPDVFATYPRVDMLHKNVHWQKMYRYIDYKFEPSRAEMPGGGRKPWPQKGLGKARAGSIRSPLFITGAKAFGPRGPKSYFYMLPRHQRAMGLRVALTCKYTQNDLVIVDSLELPTSDPQFLSEMADVRFWGYSVLFVDDTDVMPQNISESVRENPGFNLMPAYGLNVFSKLKHETVNADWPALERIEGKLIEELHSHVERKFVNQLRPEDFRKTPKVDGTMCKPPFLN